MAVGDNGFLDTSLDDQFTPDLSASTTTDNSASDPFSALSLDNWLTGDGFGAGATSATNDLLSSTDTPSSVPSGVIQFDDGTFYDTNTGQYFTANGTQAAVVGQSVDNGGTIMQMSDGSYIDIATGQKYDSSGNPVNTVTGTQPGSAAAAVAQGFQPSTTPTQKSGSVFSPSGSGGSGFSSGSGGKSSGSGTGSAASSGTQISTLSNALGQLGAAMASILGKPSTTPQFVAANQTPLGAPSVLNSSGNSLFLLMVLVVGFILLRGKN